MNEKLTEFFKLSEILSKFEKDEKSKIPYHFNVIDELHANENAHSRIFVRLLQYKEKDTYPFLVSFMKRMGIDKNVKHPRITVEKERIDNLVIDEDYAIIFENKIHGATDQHEQIKRYVETVKSEVKDYDKIYVVYLTKQGFKTVSNNSLTPTLNKKLGNRFTTCNYKHDILPWLEYDVLPNCKLNDSPLISGIQQYIDHLKGLFYLRTDLKEIKKNMENLLKDKLKLAAAKDNNEESKVLNKKIEEVNTYLTTLENMRDKITAELRKKFLDKLLEKLNKHEDSWYCVINVNCKCDFDENVNRGNFGFRNENTKVSIPENGTYRMNIEVNKDGTFICGIFLNKNEIGRETFKKFFKDKLMVTENAYWLYLKPKTFNYNANNTGTDFNNPRWNDIMHANMDVMVTFFYDEINKFFKTWKTFPESK